MLITILQKIFKLIYIYLYFIKIIIYIYNINNNIMEQYFTKSNESSSTTFPIDKEYQDAIRMEMFHKKSEIKWKQKYEKMKPMIHAIDKKRRNKNARQKRNNEKRKQKKKKNNYLKYLFLNYNYILKEKHFQILRGKNGIYFGF